MNHEHPKPGSTSRMSLPLGSSPATAEVDPVCHMTVEPATAAGSHVHAGKPYYFCSTHCLNKFRADPGRYLAPPVSTSPPPPEPAGAAYTCPMHPEVRQDHPGACPKCGM